jgi:hypothetical protein
MGGALNDDVAGIKGLSTVQLSIRGVSAFAQLRELLRKAGQRDQEREATYAIERNATRGLLFSGPPLANLRWREPLDLIEGAFRLAAFEGPVGYGLWPGRALLILILAIMLFAAIYALALATRAGGIYRLWPAGRLEQRLGSAELMGRAEAEPLLPHGLVPSFGRGLQFSLLSAFNIGFRELNVGNWISRMQTQEYTLQAVGWVRAVAGVQSLLSVYLLAMWVLTYFGRPFG